MLNFSHRLLLIFFHILVTIAQPNFIGYNCYPNSSYTTSSPYYQSNLDTAISILTSNTNITYGFYNFTYGDKPFTVHTLALCRGDVDFNTCRTCVADSAKYLRQLCSNQKEAYGWYNFCMFRYANRPIYHNFETDTAFAVIGCNVVDPNNASQPDQFGLSVMNLLEKITPIASNGDSQLKFATGNYSGTNNDTIYMLVQCTPDLLAQECENCLTASGSELLSSYSGRLGASIFKASCTLRYNTKLFYGDATYGPPPQMPVQSPDSHLGKKSSVVRNIVLIFFPIIAVVILVGLVTLLFRNGKKRRLEDKVNDNEIESVTSIVDPLQFSFSTISAATDEFSDTNKLGEGGFGPVYKGRLQNGLIAVKRLSASSRQGEAEFRNEVELVAKLKHRNLVRLLGFCVDGQERLLVYEFVPNLSLDKFLLDLDRRANLNWSKRYEIIKGVAEGLLYLHKDTQIIHRDLKASNILLDAKMNAKIADFGTSRLFTDKETQVTSRVVGTFGYMAPEYVTNGRYSVKSDVFSFGVLLLEIMSGQMSSRQNEESFQSYAWKSWRGGKAVENVIDPMLPRKISEHDIMIRCIVIGLLCVQENVNDRPFMASIVQMLSKLSTTMPEPSAPAFFMESTTNPNMPSIRNSSGTFDSNQSKTKIGSSYKSANKEGWSI